MAGQATFRIGEDDHLAAIRAVNLRHLKSRRFFARMAALTVSVALVIALLVLVSGGDEWESASTVVLGILGGTGGLALCIGIGWLLMPRRARRLYAQHRQLHQDVTIQWSNVGVRWDSASGHSQLGWGDIHAWSENRRMVLVYLTDMLVHIVPAHALTPENRDDLVATLRRNAPGRH